MNKGFFRTTIALAAIAVLSGCAGHNTSEPMISAAEFDAMIKIEVRELAPVPVDEPVTAAVFTN